MKEPPKKPLKKTYVARKGGSRVVKPAAADKQKGEKDAG